MYHHEDDDDDKARILRGAGFGGAVTGAGALGANLGGMAVMKHLGHELPSGSSLAKFLAKKSLKGAIPGAAFGGLIGAGDYLYEKYRHKKED